MADDLQPLIRGSTPAPVRPKSTGQHSHAAFELFKGRMPWTFRNFPMMQRSLGECFAGHLHNTWTHVAPWPPADSCELLLRSSPHVGGPSSEQYRKYDERWRIFTGASRRRIASARNGREWTPSAPPGASPVSHWGLAGRPAGLARARTHPRPIAGHQYWPFCADQNRRAADGFLMQMPSCVGPVGAMF